MTKAVESGLDVYQEKPRGFVGGLKSAPGLSGALVGGEAEMFLSNGDHRYVHGKIFQHSEFMSPPDSRLPQSSTITSDRNLQTQWAEYLAS